MNPSHQSAADIFPLWQADVLSGEPPVRYSCGDGELGRIELGPGNVLLLGGQPGAGKTALAMQLVAEALRRTPALKAIVANVEMPPRALLDRQLARLSGVDLTTIRRRETTAEHAGRLNAGFAEMATFADRLAFARPPFDLRTIAEAADDFEADLIALDYIQRIRGSDKAADRRASIDAVMERVRAWADRGAAVVCVAALARQKSDRGSTYDPESLSLASFRESSELEYGCDDAYILARADDADAMVLKHLKSRYGECRDLNLRFDRPRQTFLDDADGAAWAAVAKPTRADDVQAKIAEARRRANLKVVKPSSDQWDDRKDLQ